MAAQVDPVIGEGTQASVADLALIHCFESMPQPILEEIAEAAFYRDADVNETLYTVGQYDAFECFAVIQGAIKVTLVSPRTGDMAIEIVKAGDIVGLDMILADQRDAGLSISVAVEERATLIYIDSDAILSAISSSTEALQNLLKFASSRLIEQSIGEDYTVTAETRVFAALYQKVERDPADATRYNIVEMPKHRELAEIAGVTDAEAAEAVAALLQQGIAKRNYPGLIIEDYTAFKKLSAQ